MRSLDTAVVAALLALLGPSEPAVPRGAVDHLGNLAAQGHALWVALSPAMAQFIGPLPVILSPSNEVLASLIGVGTSVHLGGCTDLLGVLVLIGLLAGQAGVGDFASAFTLTGVRHAWAIAARAWGRELLFHAHIIARRIGRLAWQHGSA